MNKAKRKRLEAQGWKVGTVAEFLGLTPEESALVETKLSAHERAGTDVAHGGYSVDDAYYSIGYLRSSSL